MALDMAFMALSREQLIELYENQMKKDFPACEIKPLDILLKQFDKGLYPVFGLVEAGRVEAYALLAYNQEKTAVLLDYLAVLEASRGKGLGSRMLACLKKIFQSENVKEIFVEAECIKDAANEAERLVRTRRIHFYKKNGLKETSLMPTVFGTRFTVLIVAYEENESLREDYESIYRGMLSIDVFEKNVVLRERNSMISFYIVRHGETLLNRLNRAQGWSDSPLTDNGKKAAIELGDKLKDTHFNASYTSDLLRAEETAELILSTSGNGDIKIQKDKRLREWCLGSMEAENNTIFIQAVSEKLGASTFAELNKRLPDVAMAIYEHDTTGMAESFSDIANRLSDVFKDIGQKALLNKESNVLVVTHAFVIKTLLYLFAPEQLFSMDKVKNVSVIKLIYDGNAFCLEEMG